ncbi:hypothetical protein CANARDRAFT_6769 [[Candida] arabinofermentans NRRL YB-2248]|uniref:J domain-containing protein n=1 Tax=[Candida] arabinofermentans NRRL YB-2248 TaxID=983967 RepID=A0A1E4T3D6_9ASCO|nr:hypothetical protein CANARDRAFT_6769 [[Candida] arabinofermentans NRRL YB-2248]
MITIYQSNLYKSFIRTTFIRHNFIKLYTTSTSTTTNPDHDPEILNLIKSYPTSSKTNPYQILGFKDRSTFKQNELKSRFYKLAKIYHPDSKTYEGVSILNDNPFSFKSSSGNTILTSDLKHSRFKKVLAAYTLLKSARSKANFDKYQIGWEDNSSSFHNPPPPPPQTQTQNTKPQRSNSNFNKGTWEDHYNPQHTYHSYQWTYDDSTFNKTDPNSTIFQQFNQNRKIIFRSLLLTVLIYTLLQMTHILLYDDYIGGTYNESIMRDNVKMNERSEFQLLQSYENYGFGLSKQDRIDRFLWWREITMLLNIGELNDILNYLNCEKVSHDHNGKKLLNYDRDKLIAIDESLKRD